MSYDRRFLDTWVGFWNHSSIPITGLFSPFQPYYILRTISGHISWFDDSWLIFQTIQKLPIYLFMYRTVVSLGSKVFWQVIDQSKKPVTVQCTTEHWECKLSGSVFHTRQTIRVLVPRAVPSISNISLLRSIYKTVSLIN